MTSVDPAVLGGLVRELRLEHGMSQTRLGELAEYGKGAAVSISKLENGKLTPTPDHMEPLSAALGYSSKQLLEMAASRTADGTPPSSVEDRLASLRTLSRDRQRLSELLGAFAEARTQADEKFLEPLARSRSYAADASLDTEPRAAKTNGGAELELVRAALAKSLSEEVKPERAESLQEGTARWLSALDLSDSGTLGSAVGIGLSFDLLRRVGRPSASSLSLLLPLVAASTAVAALGTLFMGMSRRNREQEQQLAAQVRDLEKALVPTQQGVEALLLLVPRATALLDYIAVHASHALDRWTRALAPAGALSDEQQQRYREFVDIASAVLAVGAIDIEGVLEGTDEDLANRINTTRDLLDEAEQKVKSFV